MLVLADALGWKSKNDQWYNNKVDEGKFVDKKYMLSYIGKQVKDAEKAVKRKH